MKTRRLICRYVPDTILLKLANRIGDQMDKAKCQDDKYRLIDHNMDIFFAVMWKNRHDREFVNQSCNRLIKALENNRG